MATAKIELPDGTTVTVEGTVEEVNRVLELYRSPSGGAASKKPRSKSAKPKAAPDRSRKAADDAPDLNAIINFVKSVDEADAIEEQILDRPAVVNRTLLPLYIVHEYLDNAYGLTSGDVNKVTTDLGIPVSTPNASTTLSKTATRYVIGDKVRRRGVPVRYKLNRRGVQYMNSVISGASNEG